MNYARRNNYESQNAKQETLNFENSGSNTNNGINGLVIYS